MIRTTLAEQIAHDQARNKASGELSLLLNRITLAGRMIAAEIMRAGLHGKLGRTGEVNVQGEEVKALDVIANEIFLQVFANIEVVKSMASEEMEHVHTYEGERAGKYVLLFDPLDGSGNIDVCGSMGTIFSIFRRLEPGAGTSAKDFFRPGHEQIAAGYVLYGPATMFVYTAGNGVNGFTLDRSIGAFYLTHPNIQFASGKGSYAVNEANEPNWDDKTKAMVRTFREGRTACGKRSARYVGALVADFHRTMIQGGVYMYPGDKKSPNGKLRLLYECSPLAMVAREAGGAASTGTMDVLDVVPEALHQRVPLFIGAKDDVAEAVRLLQG
ncbi:MAG: class 1 fructose-bisphosphatase [Planctomycetes bacterium]|nr:class 1 fructose-bisphosphatase [Planctomycetota bacterium]